jgi:hypothetical protein
MFAEFGEHPCKVDQGWVDERGMFTSGTPYGFVGMQVYKVSDLKKGFAKK